MDTISIAESDEILIEKASKLFHPHDPTSFLQLINNLFSTDTTLRSNAVALHKITKKILSNAYVMKLTLFIRTSPLNSTRMRCATILYRLLSAPGHLIRSLDGVTQTTTKNELFCCLQNEQVLETLKMICKAASEFASDLLPKNQWDELVHLMFNGLSSQIMQQKHCSLLLFAEVIPKCPEIFSPRVDLLYESFIKILEHSTEDYGVLAAGTRASVSLLLYLTTPSTREKYYGILDYIVRDVSEIADDEDDENAQTMLEELINLGKTETSFLKLQISHMFTVMLEISRDDHLTEKTRQLAIELVITVAENKEIGCVMIQRLPNRIKDMCKMLMGMLALISDDPEWGNADNDDNNAGESSMCSYAMESMSRLANALGGNSILADFHEFFPEFVNDSNWEKRHAAATTLRLISEGCSKVLVKRMGVLVETVLMQLLFDPHPRVRWAAINVVGQFSKDLSPHLQQEFHQPLIPVLIAAMDDFACPRIQARAATALGLFIHNCSSDILKPHLQSIVSKLLTFLQKEKAMLIEAALSALGKLAESCQGDFEEYYDIVVPYMKVFTATPIDDANRMLVAKYLECITMVGLAVGRTKFRKDVQKVVEVLILLHKSYLETNDPVKIHVLQAWGRLCKCLGSEFLPCLSVAMPQLLQSAEIKNYMSEAESDENMIDGSDDESMTEVTAGNGDARIKENVIEEKAVACNILCSVVAELKEELHLWFHEIVQALAPLVGFKYHDDVNSSAISAMPLIFKSAVLAVEKGLPMTGYSKFVDLSDIIFPALQDALDKKLKMEISERILEALNECVQILGTHLNESQVTRLIDGLIEFLSDCSYKKSERETRVKKGLDMRPKELRKEEIEQEERIYAKVADYLGTFIRIYKASSFPFLDKVLPCISDIWGKDKGAGERKLVLRIFHDVAEQCREEAFTYYEKSVQFIFKAGNNDDTDVRQFVACGIGIWAEFGGDAFKSHIEEGISSLKAIIEQPNTARIDYMPAHEAAVSALGKICWFHSEQIKNSEVVSFWLNHLPIEADLVEAKIVHEQLCSMVEMSDNKVLGVNRENDPKIIKIFTEVLWAGNNLATAETVDRMIKLLKQFHSESPLFESFYASMHPGRENMIRSFLSS